MKSGGNKARALAFLIFMTLLGGVLDLSHLAAQSRLQTRASSVGLGPWPTSFGAFPGPHGAPYEADRSRHPAPRRLRVAPVRPRVDGQLLGAERWASSLKVRRLRLCESTDNYRDTAGYYRGAYQMDEHFWVTYGGNPRLTPDQAPPWEQDLVAYRGFLARGYEPWPVCGKL